MENGGWTKPDDRAVAAAMELHLDTEGFDAVGNGTTKPQPKELNHPDSESGEFADRESSQRKVAKSQGGQERNLCGHAISPNPPAQLSRLCALASLR